MKSEKNRVKVTHLTDKEKKLIRSNVNNIQEQATRDYGKSKQNFEHIRERAIKKAGSIELSPNRNVSTRESRC